MGFGYILTCPNQECDYKTNLFCGVGMMFHKTYREVMDSARKGLISEKHTQFLKEHPDGAINTDTKIYQCKDCHHIFTEFALDMYIPRYEDYNNLPEKGIWSSANPVEGENYVTPYDLSMYYKLCKRHTHHCPECGGKATVVNNINRIKKICPKCGSPLLEETIMWD